MRMRTLLGPLLVAGLAAVARRVARTASAGSVEDRGAAGVVVSHN